MPEILASILDHLVNGMRPRWCLHVFGAEDILTPVASSSTFYSPLLSAVVLPEERWHAFAGRESKRL